MSERINSVGEPGAKYVALGSSFAAGLGLGPRAPGSRYPCGRSINGYPQQLARLVGLSLVDKTCSGATTKHVLQGGQYFQGPQLDALDAETALVTLTIGGNDVRYVGDLILMAGRNQRSIVGWLLRRRSKVPQSAQERNFVQLQDDLRTTLSEIRRRSPRARVVVVTYPAILPPHGSCPTLGLTEAEAALMRQVGARLAEVTRAVAREAGADVVDMDTLSIDHHACAAIPWVNGWEKAEGATFHPTLAGAEATAKEIAELLKSSA